MKTTIGRVTNPDFVQAVRELCAVLFPTFADNYNASILYREVSAAVDANVKARTAVITKLGGIPDDSTPGKYTFTAANIPDVQKAIAAIDAEEFTLTDFPPVTLPRTASIRPISLALLADFITIEPEPPTKG